MKKGFKLLALLMVSVFVMGLAACETTQKKEEAVEVESTDKQTEEEMARQEQMELERMRAEEEERRWLEEQEKMVTEQEAEMGTGAEAAGMEAYDADTVLQMVHFDFDKYDIKDEFRDVLANNAEWINSHPDTQVQVEGHCDERGTDEYNLALGERRAMAVKNYLVSLGVDESRLYTISYGEEMPLEMGHDESAWGKNRRTQFRVTSR